MEGGADDSTNRTIDEASLTPQRANTPEIPPPPPPPTTIKPNESINLNDTIIDRNDCGNNTVKPTFKNLQQAKKRLHAFSVQKLNQLPTSPLAKKVRLDEKIDETAKKTPKRHKDPNEKAKAVIEEIEEIKRNEQAYLESVRASIDKEHFKKIEKKSRHIRKRSPSLEKSKKINITINNNINESSNNKEKKRYPKNWKELQEFELSFDELNREFDLPPPKGNNDVPRQLLFELPSLPIVETKIKTLNREDRLVPFQFVRFTKCKPIISFSINFNTIKEKYPSRRTILETIPKEMAANIEKLHSTSLKFKTDFNIKVRNWFPKSWINYNYECKLLENSVGLSFLQSYTEDEDNEPTTSTNNNNNNDSKIDNSGNKIESSNISNKNKEKKKTTKKKKKSNKKHSETKKKQKRSKTEQKLKKKKKKKHTKEKKHRSDEKIEEIDEKTANKIEKIDDRNVEIENNTIEEMKIETINDEIDNQHDDNEEIEDRCIKTTPDTEDYHSHWESDDDLTKIKPLRPSIKLNRSWESDEELFERTGNSNNNTNDNNNSNNKRKQCDYNNLEIPLNLTNLITRKSINIIDNNNDEEANNENNNKMEILKPVNLNLDLDMMKSDNNNSSNLENQYEEFIKAVSTDSSFNQQQIEDNNDNNKQLIVSNSDNIHNNNNIAVDDGGDSSSSDTSTSTSSSSTTTSSTSTSSDNSSTNRNDNNLANNNNNSKKKKKKKYKLKKSKRKRNKIQDIFNEFDIPVPSDLPDVGNGGNNGNNLLPLPVPSPDQTLLSNNDGVDLKKPFIFPTITIQSKKTLLDHTKLKLNDDSDSCDFTEKFLKKSNEIVPEDFPITTTTTTITTMIENEDVKKIKQDKKQTNDNRNKRNHRDQRDRDSKHKNSTKKPLRRRYSSPLLRRYSPTTMKRRHLSPILSQKQRRKSPSSPSRYRRSPKRKRSRSPKSRQITTTTKRALSPINSPLDGFKKSVADSTISDDMLPQPSSIIDDYSQSPISTYNNNNSINIATKFFDKCDNISSMIDNKNGNNHNNSPKRLSLDDRINQVLGLEKIDNNDNKQQQIDHYHDYNNYHQYDQQYYGQYPQNYTNYNLTPVQQSQTTKVVQVGNILQVVPTDEVPHNLIDNKTTETGQKIVQVGNMLQIVPAVLQPTTTIVDNTTPTTIETTPIINQDDNNQQIEEYLMKQKSLERKAEREKRRLERTRRRKEKEKKRKEREKRRQLKLKLKTENMIKKALQLEAETLFDEDDDVENSTQWPPIQVVVSTSSDAPNKGILQTGGFSKIDGKKSVQFADGIRPGEGTSPSGGEELSSPPPKTTKRHKKIKLPKKSKKKKIKVKVKRIQQQQQQQLQPQENGIDDNIGGNDVDDNDDDYENLPPPSPPPGSPPPHVFPSRVKEPPFNNINPYIVTNPAYVTNYPRQTLPPSQIMINRPPYMAGSFHPDLHPNSFVGTNHGIPSHH